MALWKDGKGWRYEFQYLGARYPSKHYPLKKEAAAAMETHKKQIRNEMNAEKPTAITFLNLATDYLDFSERKHAKKTYEYKAMVCRKFLAFAGEDIIIAYRTRDLLQTIIDPVIIESYLRTRPTNHNYNVHLIELHVIFNYGIKKKFLAGPNPCAEVEKMPVTQVVKYIPSEEDLLKVMLAAGLDKPLIIVLFHTLARIDEILRLRWDEVNFTRSTIRLWTRKRAGGNFEHNDMPMNSDLHAVLWNLWKGKDQDEWVFFNEKTGTRYNRRPKLMPGICKRAGVKPFGFHAIRHFAASFLADQDKISKKAISGLLRHKTLSTTEKYLHSIDESQKQAADALKNFSMETVSEKTTHSNHTLKKEGVTT